MIIFKSSPKTDVTVKEIGGYFEWEITRGSNSLHPQASLALKSGRACVSYLVQLEQPQKVWLPYYTCDALLEPLREAGIPTAFYAIDTNLEINHPWPELQQDERIIYINYFGLKTDYVEHLETHYGHVLWIDHTQAFFYIPEHPHSAHFNSARKSFGVPDGAYLYLPSDTSAAVPDAFPRNNEYLIEHLVLRLQGRTQDGYPIFGENEIKNGGAIAQMSTLTEATLSHINYAKAAHRRISNYLYLHKALQNHNQLPSRLLSLPNNTVPYAYPFLPNDPIDKSYFWERKLYIPILWKGCLNQAKEAFVWENKLASDLLPLPIDHRYDEEDMAQVVALIKAYDA